MATKLKKAIEILSIAPQPPSRVSRPGYSLSRSHRLPQIAQARADAIEAAIEVA